MGLICCLYEKPTSYWTTGWHCNFNDLCPILSGLSQFAQCGGQFDCHPVSEWSEWSLSHLDWSGHVQPSAQGRLHIIVLLEWQAWLINGMFVSKSVSLVPRSCYYVQLLLNKTWHESITFVPWPIATRCLGWPLHVDWPVVITLSSCVLHSMITLS